MAAPRTGPCANWAVLADLEVCPDCGPDAEIDPLIRAAALESASYLLFMLSGRQFSGSCEATVRPCRRCTGQSSGYGWPIPYGWTDSWGFCGCGASEPRRCGCGGIDELTLGAEPVTGITQVKIDGAVLAAGSYRVDDYRYLVRIDGDSWPSCQDLTEPASSVDTFEVSYTYGVAPPEAGKRAAARLACELAKAYSGRRCMLPERIQTITRQDISMAFIDPFDFLDKGKTGIYEVDLFLKASNPYGRVRKAIVTSPDVPRRVRRTGT